MATFREICLTPTEFGRLTQLDKSEVDFFIEEGALETTRRRVGNVDRKLIPLESIRSFYSKTRALLADPNVVASNEQLKKFASRHGRNFVAPKHKKQLFYNVKGGTGKSTLSAQVAMRASMMGFKVLALDLDGQGHLSLNVDLLDAHERPTVYDILINDLPIQEAIVEVAPGLDLIPANLGLCNIEIPLNQKPRREYRLSEALDTVIDNYDLVVADTNPAASILNCSMLVAADVVNVVCATNPLSFHGLSLVMSTIEEMEREFRRDLVTKIIPNMYDAREVISQEVLGELRSQFSEQCAESVVNKSADLNEATKRRTTVWDVNTRGSAAQDINSLTHELVAIGYEPVQVVEEVQEPVAVAETAAESVEPAVAPSAEVSTPEVSEPSPVAVGLPEAVVQTQEVQAEEGTELPADVSAPVAEVKPEVRPENGPEISN